jgi:8-oxo-dGTP pyrophosphatase MutT (NUDIX family)
MALEKKTTSPRLDYRNRFMEVHHTHADFGAFQKDYYVIDLGPRAGVVAVQEGHVLLTRQYRFLIDAYTWEIPGGRVDEGETPEVAVVRECIEETGVRCDGLEKLLTYYPGLDNFNNRTTLFSASRCEVVAPFKPDPSEVLEIRWMRLEECLEMAFRGDILDALTVTGLLAHQVKAGEKR